MFKKIKIFSFSYKNVLKIKPGNVIVAERVSENKEYIRESHALSKMKNVKAGCEAMHFSIWFI